MSSSFQFWSAAARVCASQCQDQATFQPKRRPRAPRRRKRKKGKLPKIEAAAGSGTPCRAGSVEPVQELLPKAEVQSRRRQLKRERGPPESPEDPSSSARHVVCRCCAQLLFSRGWLFFGFSPVVPAGPIQSWGLESRSWSASPTWSEAESVRGAGQTWPSAAVGRTA